MDAHSPMKTTLNPATKLSVLRNATLLETADPGVAPISWPTKAGTIGRKHGEANDTTPANRASGIVISMSRSRARGR